MGAAGTPPALSLYTGGLTWGHATHVPLPSRECKSGAGLWEVLQLDGSYHLDEHLKPPQVSWLQPQRPVAVHGLYWGCRDGGAWPLPRGIPCVLTHPAVHGRFPKAPERLHGAAGRRAAPPQRGQAGPGDLRPQRRGRGGLRALPGGGEGVLAAGRMLPSCAGAGCWATANSTFPQMKIPVVQTSLPGLARNLEGLQKMQVSGGAGGGGCLPVRGDVLTPLSPPAEEQHRGGAAGRRGPGSVADAKLHGTIAGGFGGESATGWGLVELPRVFVCRVEVGEQGLCCLLTSLSRRRSWGKASRSSPAWCRTSRYSHGFLQP